MYIELVSLLLYCMLNQPSLKLICCSILSSHVINLCYNKLTQPIYEKGLLKCHSGLLAQNINMANLVIREHTSWKNLRCLCSTEQSDLALEGSSYSAFSRQKSFGGIRSPQTIRILWRAIWRLGKATVHLGKLFLFATSCVLAGTFVSFVVDPSYILELPSSTLTFTCNVTYTTPLKLNDSVPWIRWDTELINADVTDQSMFTSGVLAYSNLNLNDVNSSFCGVYICSAMDRFTGLPSTGNVTAIVNTGMFQMGNLGLPSAYPIIKFTLRHGMKNVTKRHPWLCMEEMLPSYIEIGYLMACHAYITAYIVTMRG
ncbi:hypothetical protein SPONN_2549 [uncultured Candidatus Thioglobus sp.]|nr:hypothetical protein SPONN_2549 [uncultured Candidatus Thioglobus sp.]